MATCKIKGDKSSYFVRDKECLGKECLRLGYYQIRGTILSGSRNSTPCCMTRAYPDDLYQIELAVKRKKEGYKIV